MKALMNPPGTCVTEELDIRVAKGRFCLNNADSSHGYNYTAWGHIAAKLYLVGDWESIRPGANAHGAFILTISAQGNSMYGYWVGPPSGFSLAEISTCPRPGNEDAYNSTNSTVFR